MDRLRQLLGDEQGPTAVEYALLASAIAAVIIAIVYVIGGKTNNNFNKLASNGLFGG